MPLSAVILDGLHDRHGNGNDVLLSRFLCCKLKNGSSSDLAVDASGALQEFSISAEESVSKEIKQIRLLLYGKSLDITSIASRDFSSDHADGLTNGLELYFSYGEDQVDLFLDPIKILSDFYWYADGIQNDLKAIDSQVDLLMVQFDLIESVKLLAGTSDKLSLSIHDDLSGFTRFEVMVQGLSENEAT